MSRSIVILAVLLGLILGFGLRSNADQPIGFSLGIQKSGASQGAAVVMNFSTGVSVSLAGGVATVTATGTPPSSNSLIRSIGAGFDGGGSALTAGTASTVYFTVPFACTIAAWNATVDTGTITFDVWKIASGTAIPTVSNTITAMALPAISSGTALHSTTLTGWTTAVTANDIFGVEINAVSLATRASLVLQCNAS